MTLEEEYEEIYVEQLTPAELVEYARYGEEGILTELVAQNLQERLGSADERGSTMLHMFAANGHLSCMRTFLAHCPHVETILNKQNSEGNTALHWACVAGQLAAVQLLVAAGATVAIENKAERTPICEAHKHQRMAVLKFFEETLERKDDGGCAEESMDGTGDLEGIGSAMQMHETGDLEGIDSAMQMHETDDLEEIIDAAMQMDEADH